MDEDLFNSLLNLQDILEARRALIYHSDSDEEQTEVKKGDIQDKLVIQGHVSTCKTFAGKPIQEAYEGEKVAMEMRVVRAIEKDKKRIYTIGTIVESGKEQVKVQWDTDKNKVEALNMKELRLYDNAQIGVKHHNIVCDGCDEYPLPGIRWKCLKCSNYDLCTACYMADKHYLSHSFERIQSKKSKGSEVPPRDITNWFRCSGILKSARVTLRENPDELGEGTVIKLSDKKVHAFMCDAIVEMDRTKTSRRFCVGRDGKSELQYTEKGVGISYYKDHLPVMRSSSSKPGMRVVRGPAFDEDDNFHKDGGDGGVGTVINVSKTTDSKQEKTNSPPSNVQGQKPADNDSGTRITVRWDNGEKSYHNTNSGKCRELRLFDNRQIGIEHKAFCDECPQKPKMVHLKGMRWKCADCWDYDLCTDCYMSDKHMEEDNKHHRFFRIIDPNSKRKKIEKQRGDPNAKTKSFGIFKDATVEKVQDGVKSKRQSEFKASGKVVEIQDCRINTGRSNVIVEWKNRHKEERPFIELQCKKQGDFDFLYPDHLPILGNDPRGYISLNYGDEDSQKKIEVNLWYRTELEEIPSSKPILYLIFANHPELEQKMDMVLVEEIIDFSRKSSSFCHLIGAKMLLHHTSDGNDEVFIHKSTDNDIIQELVKKGYRTFHRGDTDETEEDIDYFLRMAKTCSGEKMLPVIVSLRNGGLRKNILNNVGKSKTPILCFKKQSLDVFILTTRKEVRGSVKMIKYQSNLRAPGKIVSEKREAYDKGMFDRKDDNEEITYITDIFYESENLEAHICHLLLGVAVNTKKKPNIFGEDTCTYIEALSVHLLKEGKWKLPMDTIKVPFSERCIELIFEEDLTSDFEKGLWKDLQDRSGSAYSHPKWREKTRVDPTDEDSYSETSEESDDDISDIDDVIKPSTAPKPEKPLDQDDGVHEVKNKSMRKTNEMELSADSSEMYGLMFYALLKKGFYFGAKQLIETGCIRIPQIFVGCVIVQDAANDWKTSHTEKEKLMKMNKIFAQQAIRITNCIHDEDKIQKSEKKQDKNSKIFHTGRLLLNHGYLENAIKTQNKTYLDNNTIKEILNKMWYGEEKLSYKRIGMFVMLAIIHPIMLPILMITLGNTPLKWFYNQYNLPFVKVSINLIGFVLLLIIYAYMLLFEYNDSLSFWDYIIIGWMVSFFLDENKQHIVAIRRGKWKSYVSDWWNRLDWLAMITYASGMLCKLGQGSEYKDAARAILVIAFIMLSIRILNMFCMSEILGPKLVSIRKMFTDTFAFMVIMTVIMISFNVSSYALLYPNSDLTFSTMERVMSNGFWMLFGELNLETWDLAVPDCSFNSSIYRSGELPRCPSRLGIMVAPYLKGVYGMIAVILMLNLLIAMYSDTFQKVHMESEFYWSELQIDFLEEYSVKSVFPIHMQLLALVVGPLQLGVWFFFRYLTSKIYSCICHLFDDDDNISCYSEDSEVADTWILKQHPMFVRAFFYDTTFDLRLKKTYEAEETGALKAKGEVEVWKKDKITKLRRQIETQAKKQEKQNEKHNERYQKTMKKLKKLKTGLDNILELLIVVYKDHTHEHRTSPPSLEQDSDWDDNDDEYEESEDENDIYENIYEVDD